MTLTLTDDDCDSLTRRETVKTPATLSPVFINVNINHIIITSHSRHHSLTAIYINTKQQHCQSKQLKNLHRQIIQPDYTSTKATRQLYISDGILAAVAILTMTWSLIIFISFLLFLHSVTKPRHHTYVFCVSWCSVVGSKTASNEDGNLFKAAKHVFIVSTKNAQSNMKFFILCVTPCAIYSQICLL